MSTLNVDQIAEQVQQVVASDRGGSQRKAFPLHEPCFAGKEWDYVKECLDSGWVSSVGKYVDLFERKLAAYTGTGYAIAAASGTAALHISLLLAGVRPQDEVLVPAVSFIATANAVVYCGATPHFVDVEEATLGVDPDRLRKHLETNARKTSEGLVNARTSRPIRVLVVMHAFGTPARIDALAQVAEEFGLALVEDAAESLGSLYKGRHTGSWGLVSSVSFNGNKIITTGGGGAILTNDERLAKRAKHLTTTAKAPHAWDFFHDEVGYNYRMPNLNAALGCAQLEQLDVFVERKRALARKYSEAFRGVYGAKIFEEPEEARSNYWLNSLILSKADRAVRDQALSQLHERKILARPLWNLLSGLPVFAGCPSADLSVSENLQDRVISLPSSASLA